MTSVRACAVMDHVLRSGTMGALGYQRMDCVMLLIAGLLVALASPEPSPSATPRVEIHGYGAHVFVDQATNGPGQVPPEGAAYRNGAPTAPMTPYDLFSDDPVVPGVSGELSYQATLTIHTPSVSYDAALTFAGIQGDLTNSIYWNEPFFGPLDPHEGRAPVTFLPAYPTSPSTNDVSLWGASLPASLSARANNSAWRVSGGYVNPASFDRFVFAPAPVLDATPQLGVQTLETLSPGTASLASWIAAPTAIPLLGADGAYSFRNASLELTDALLPMYPGTTAHLTGASFVLDRGSLGRYSANVIDVRTAGDPVVVPSIFGAGALLHPGAQGNLATSSVAEQHEVDAGIRAFFHPLHTDVTIEAGRSWYNAGLVAIPGSAQPGNYLHLAVARAITKQANAGVDLYRVDARYGTIMLPYGAFENL